MPDNVLTALFVFGVGLALSAFFSGSETGFYRVARVRLLIDALGGDRIAKALLWSSNNPAAFVGTALVGNNVANNVTAFATVMLTNLWFPGVAFAEVGLTMASTPIVFIFGELLPKRLFFRAPYRLLRQCAPGLAIAAALFSVFSVLLWFVSQLLQRISRAPTQTVRMELAKRELTQVLDEGHAVGLLTPTQRLIAQNAFGLGGRPIREFTVPASRQAKATTKMSRQDVLRLASRQKLPVLPVEDPNNKRAIVGYVSAVDCLLDSQAEDLPLKQLSEATGTESYLSVLLRLQTAEEPIVAVRSDSGELIGFATTLGLRESLLEETVR